MQFLRNFLPAAVLVFTFAGCKKQTGSDDGAFNLSLSGTWELHHSFGGMMRPATYNPGNGSLLRFNGNNYQLIRSGQILLQGSYRLVRDSFVDVTTCAYLPPKSATPNWIVADSSNGLKTYFEINGNILKLTSGCIPADGGGSLYKRKSTGQ